MRGTWILPLSIAFAATSRPAWRETLKAPDELWGRQLQTLERL